MRYEEKSRPSHLSDYISDKDDDTNFQNGSPNWSRSQSGEYWFGTEADTIARVVPSRNRAFKLLIDKRFPALGYDELEVDDEPSGMRSIHEWWSVCVSIGPVRKLVSAISIR